MEGIMRLITYINQFLGEIIFPKSLNPNSAYILHLFNTPSYTYVMLDRLLSTGAIVAIIHSGNLCSDFSVRKDPSKIITYEDNLHLLRRLVTKHNIQDFALSLSRHDHLPSIKRVLPNAQIYETSGTLKLLNRTYHFSHQPQLTENEDFDLKAGSIFAPISVPELTHTSVFRSFIRQGRRICHLQLIDIYSGNAHLIEYYA